MLTAFTRTGCREVSETVWAANLYTSPLIRQVRQGATKCQAAGRGRGYARGFDGPVPVASWELPG